MWRIAKRLPDLVGGLLSTSDDGVFNHQQVHLGPQEAIEGLLWFTNDRLVLIEGRVEHHRHVCQLMKALDKLPELWIGVAMDGLQSG